MTSIEITSYVPRKRRRLLFPTKFLEAKDTRMEQSNPTQSNTPPAKQTRSRTGCWTCRDAGYKCDEQKPNCGRCMRLRIHCKGYGSRLKWRSHNSASVAKWPRTRRKSGTPTSQDEMKSGGSYQANSPAASESQLRCMSPHPHLEDLPLSTYPSFSLRPCDMTLEQYKLLHCWTVYTSPLLCISPVSQTNPFQMHLTPMVLLDDGPLRHAVLSVAASHLAASADTSQSLALVAQNHRVCAIAALREQLNNKSVAYNDATLAAILVLEVSKQFDDGAPRYDVNHLIGAKELIRGRGGPQSLTSPCSRFLLTQVLYYDLLSAVSRGSSPLVDYHWLTQHDNDDFSNPLETSRGYHATVLEALARISVLKARKEMLQHTGQVTSSISDGERKAALAEFTITGREVERQLELMVISANDPDQAWTTEGHRSAALIYLYRVVYDIGAPHPLTLTQVRRCIDAISSVDCSSPSTSAHVWPLFTAGCEATDSRDREFVKQRLNDMYQRRKIPSLQKVGELMEQVWLTKDFKNAMEGAEQMCRVGCIEVIKSLGEMLQLV